MAFFQNNNTVTTTLIPVPPLSTIGFDSIPLGLSTNWEDFIANPIHSERREAFKEFVFLMVFHRNRELEGVKFPHNVLFEKVLKFFVETIPSTTSGFPIPINNSGNKIFNENSLGSYYKYDPISGSTVTLMDKTPVLRGQLTAPSMPNIQLEINIALATGNTSIGFFEEVAILFAHYYLFRQLTIFNGHAFNFTATLGLNTNGQTISQVVKKSRDEDIYLSTSTVTPTLSSRTTSIIRNVDVAPISRPYYFNSLFDTLSSLGFQIPSTPIVSPSSIFPYSTINHEKIFLAYFVKILDPTRFMGITISPRPTSNSGAAFTISPPFTGIPSGTGSSLKNAITSDPTASSMTQTTRNSFIKDLFVTLRSGNDGPDLGGAGGSVFTSTPKRPFFINSTSLVFNTPPSSSEIYSMIQRVFNELKDTTQRALQVESKAILSYFLNRSDIDAHNTILASGIGESTVSILGFRNWGLPFFNYEMGANANLSRSNSATKTISLEKREAIHVGTYALDLFGIGAYPSKFDIKVDGIENYRFQLIPEALSAGVTGDLNITPVNLPYSSGVDFYNVYNSTTEIWSYYRRLPRIGASGSGVPELVAEYHKKQRDLIFREFNDFEINQLFNFRSIYSSRNSKTIEYKVQSNYRPDDSVTEELLTLISIYEDVYPGIISEDSLYEDDTFQLFGSFASSKPLNSASYNRLLSSRNEIQGIQLIFDLIANANYVVNFLPPVLKGSYVGKIPSTGSGIGSGSSRVIPDTDYTPKYGPSAPKSEVAGVPSGQESTFEAIKYSWGRFVLTQSPAYPAIPTTIDVKLEITSYVNPSISYLDSNVNSAAVSLLNSKINTTTPNAKYNQVLAMLRSFGLLEGIVEKMKVMAISHPESMSILAKLDEWLPMNGTPEADSIICVDENVLSSAVVRAQNITLNEYYQFKN